MLYKYKYLDSLITFYCLNYIIQLVLECLVYSNNILEHKFSLDHRSSRGTGCGLFHLPVFTAYLCEDSLSFIKEYLYFGIITRFKIIMKLERSK